MSDVKICNKCGSKSFNGDWKFGKWFCSCCLEYCNISDADSFGTRKEDHEDEKEN
ncbi:MAG: hypothetical protein ABIH59_02615 [archaeon]